MQFKIGRKLCCTYYVIGQLHVVSGIVLGELHFSHPSILDIYKTGLLVISKQMDLSFVRNGLLVSHWPYGGTRNGEIVFVLGEDMRFLLTLVASFMLDLRVPGKNFMAVTKVQSLALLWDQGKCRSAGSLPPLDGQHSTHMELQTVPQVLQVVVDRPGYWTG